MIVWLASYPRSGNTFFRVILNKVFGIKTYSIYDDKSDIGADEKTSEIVGHEFLPENFDIQKARDAEKVYYIKTHELLDRRVDDHDKVIYLIRDGRESTLSFTKHQNTFSNQNKHLIDTIYGNTFIGSWGEHVNSWDPKNRANTLLVKFEKLTKEPIKYIEGLSEFLQVTSVGERIPTFEELKKINPIFFRSGKTNSWEDVYTKDEHHSFWLKNCKVMGEYEYNYKKPDLVEDIENNRFIFESINQNNYLINVVLENNKKLQIANQKSVQKQSLINEKNEQLTQKQSLIEEKNEQLAKKQSLLNEKNKQLAEKQSLLDEKTKKLNILNKQIDNLYKVSIVKNPVIKVQEYKKLLTIYHDMEFI